MPNELTSMQVRAARALLAWSQSDLATAANVASSTVADFEKGHRVPVANNADAIRTALEHEGILFLPGGAVNRDVHKYAASAQPKEGQPIQWITSSDLQNWARSRFGQSDLSELIRRLIYATYGPNAILDFPSGDGIARPGPDGVCRVEEARGVVPAGRSVWELTTTDPKKTRGKAIHDYEKYLAPQKRDLFPNATFVFVTTQRWGDKEAWTQAQNTDGRWNDVVALDGEDLVQWLDRCPGVALWLAGEIKKLPPKMLRLSDVWDEWSLATRIPLSRDLILAGRDEAAKSVMAWLDGTPELLALQAESAEEALAFLYAAIAELPVDYANRHLSRTVFAQTEEAARKVGNGMSALVICLDNAEVGLAQSLVAKGHHVILAMDGHSPLVLNRVQLPRPKKIQIKEALLAMLPRGMEKTGSANENPVMSERDAKKLAADSARSLTVLRRLLPPSPGRFPDWAKAPLSRALRAALLAGGWDEDRPQDIATMERLAGTSYADFVRDLRVGDESYDSPLRKAGGAWKVASPRDAFILVARHLTEPDLKLFGSEFVAAMIEVDPRHSLNSEDRWHASREAEKLRSEFLKRGLGETAILLSIYHEQLKNAGRTVEFVDGLIDEILADADAQRWWSLREDLLTLAEASPERFLNAIGNALDVTPTTLSAILQVDKHPLYGRDHLYGLLGALEALAWSPDYLLPVSQFLAQMAHIDNGERKSGGPLGALRQIFLPWFPQTSAEFDDRMRVIDALISTWPDQAWSLLLSLAPRMHDFSDMNAEPKWRDFSVTEQPKPNALTSARNSEAVLGRLIALAGQEAGRWSQLIQLLGNFWPDQRKRLRDAFISILDRFDDHDRQQIRTDIRVFLHGHRISPEAVWALPEEELQPLQEAYERLEPSDVVQRLKWLFEPRAVSANPKPYGSGGIMDSLAHDAQERAAAIKTLIEYGGVDAVFELNSGEVKPERIGEALFDAKIADDLQTEILQRAFQSEKSNDWLIAQDLFGRNAYTRESPWSQNWLLSAIRSQWSDEIIDRLLLYMRNDRETWMIVAAMGAAVDDRYWKARSNLYDGSIEDISYAAERLIAVGRPSDAVSLLGARIDKEPAPDLVVRALKAAVNRRFESDNSNDITMFTYYVGLSLDYLEGAGVGHQTIVELEWSYFQLLQYGQRPPRHLHRELAENPRFFVSLLELIFKPTAESKVADVTIPAEKRKQMATLAWRVLKDWEVVPGSDEAGNIDPVVLDTWVDEVRAHCASLGRETVGDHQIGEILAASVWDDNDIWPPKAVSDIIERVKSKELEDGVSIGAFNRRGVTTRLTDEGGNQERILAARYRNSARHYGFGARRTSALLNSIAKSYESDARRQDEQAEQNDWRYS